MSQREPGADQEAALREQVRTAAAGKTPLRIVGGDSKSFYGRAPRGETLSTRGHRGILHYEPTELVLTARAGTPLVAIEAALDGAGQMLGFEPPHFGPSATWGGAIACGLSGPRRPFAGAVRDFVLGCRLINGRGEALSFGGEVMKNVAGFDVSRLMVGALGTLGVLLDVSGKVLPKPESERTVSFACGPDEARSRMIRWMTQSWPITAMAYDGLLRVRLSGAEAAVLAAARQLGGEGREAPGEFWTDLREQRLAFFSGGEDLWRVSVPPAAPALELPGRWLIDWGGALRWLKTDAEPARIFAAAARAGGNACLFRSARGEGRFHPLPAGLKTLHGAVKQAFDPNGIFNVGRMYEDW